MTGQQSNLFSATASEVVQGLREKFQIMATDHADIDEGWFQDCVRKRFRQGTDLVPQEVLQ
ncbi:MAG: DUF3732 domain-containing protein [Planctomycetota bacterium]|jgi:hypothetical protein